MNNIIEVKYIHKFYKDGNESLEALKGVSFEHLDEVSRGGIRSTGKA